MICTLSLANQSERARANWHFIDDSDYMNKSCTFVCASLGYGSSILSLASRVRVQVQIMRI